eukprot:Pgem_evm1s16994
MIRKLGLKVAGKYKTTPKALFCVTKPNNIDIRTQQQSYSIGNSAFDVTLLGDNKVHPNYSS